MMRRRSALVLAALAALFAAPGLAARQGADWRAPFLASFDLAWQTVRDNHYDPTLGGLDWAAVGREFRPQVEAAVDPAAARNAIRAMLGRIGQSHFTLLTGAEEPDSLRGPATIAVDVRWADGRALVTRVAPTGAAYRAGLRPGDELQSIDGQPVVPAERNPSERPELAAFSTWRHIARALSGSVGSEAHLVVRTPDGSLRMLDVAREIESGDVVALGNLPPLRARLETDEITAGGPAGSVRPVRIGMISFNVWMPAIAVPLEAAIDRFRSADGLILDLSGNPGGLVDMMRGVAGHVLDEPALIGRMQMRDLSLEFRANPRRSTTDGRRVTPYAGPLAIVVDGMTASASECFAAGLQSLGRARVFGTRTMGQALPARTITLPSGDVLMFVVGDFTTSTGERVEGRGVTPDEVVSLDPAALAAGRDARWHAQQWLARQSFR